jgi:hypothetical protein
MDVASIGENVGFVLIFLFFLGAFALHFIYARQIHRFNLRLPRLLPKPNEYRGYDEDDSVLVIRLLLGGMILFLLCLGGSAIYQAF